jgi:hypothetical protein
VARSPQNSCGQRNYRSQQIEYALHSNSHQPERQQQEPYQRIEHQRQKRQRPTQEQQNAPKQEFHHGIHLEKAQPSHPINYTLVRLVRLAECNHRVGTPLLESTNAAGVLKSMKHRHAIAPPSRESSPRRLVTRMGRSRSGKHGIPLNIQFYGPAGSSSTYGGFC